MRNSENTLVRAVRPRSTPCQSRRAPPLKSTPCDPHTAAEGHRQLRHRGRRTHGPNGRIQFEGRADLGSSPPGRGWRTPGTHADDHAPPAVVGAIARQRAHEPARRDGAGFPLTAGFEYVRGPVYGRCAGACGGPRERRLPAWPEAAGTGPAAAPVRHILQSNGGGMGNDDGGFMNTRRAADYLGLSPRTLDGYRVSGDGPAFHRFGNRVRYRRPDLDEWAAKPGEQPRRQRPTGLAWRKTGHAGAYSRLGVPLAWVRASSRQFRSCRCEIDDNRIRIDPPLESVPRSPCWTWSFTRNPADRSDAAAERSRDLPTHSAAAA